MTYDYHGTWDEVTGLNSPLYARDSEPFNETKSSDWKNANFSINYWIQNGCPPEKINFGLAAYGTFTFILIHFLVVEVKYDIINRYFLYLFVILCVY